MRNYLRITRSLTYSILFAVPLFLCYELGAAYLADTQRMALRNGADVLLRDLLAAVGVNNTVGFTGVLLATGAVLIWLERRRRNVRLSPLPFAGMMIESVIYALFFGAVVGTATQWLLHGVGPRLAVVNGPLESLGVPEGLVLSLGAGIYEELLFRVLLVGGLWGIFRSSGVGRTRAGVFAAVLAAIVFSAFHYIGPYGDAWALQSFVFRFIAGLAFSVLFLLRGFGITAWTHALYDVLIFLTQGF